MNLMTYRFLVGSGAASPLMVLDVPLYEEQFAGLERNELLKFRVRELGLDPTHIWFEESPDSDSGLEAFLNKLVPGKAWAAVYANPAEQWHWHRVITPQGTESAYFVDGAFGYYVVSPARLR